MLCSNQSHAEIATTGVIGQATGEYWIVGGTLSRVRAMGKIGSKTAIDEPSALFDTRHRARDQKRMAVLTTAAELFLTRGYHRTRMDDVADHLRITKPALYNYFRSKHEILFDCHMLGHDLIDTSLEEIESRGGNGLERLKELIRAYSNIMTQKFGMCLVLLDEHELTPKQLATVTQRRRSVNERFEAYIRQGIEDHSVLLCNIRLTAFGIAGALNWISHWYKPGKGLRTDELADYFAESLTRGLDAQINQLDRNRPSTNAVPMPN